MHKKRYIIGAILICVAVGIIFATALSSCSVKSYTVSELLQEGNSVYGETVTVDGKVAEDSVLRQSESLHLEFLLVDENERESIRVFYARAEPDNFSEGRGITVKGELHPDGHFDAHEIITQCASKYVPEE
ncbi:MAG: cytochrome c maturation protein CcmE [Dehalococcoidia bacterium]